MNMLPDTLLLVLNLFQYVLYVFHYVSIFLVVLLDVTVRDLLEHSCSLKASCDFMQTLRSLLTGN